MEEAGRIGHGPSSDPNSLAAMLTMKLPATLGDLQRVKLLTAESLGPVWNERAMGGARGGIFRNARPWGKKTRDEVAVVAGRRNNDA